MTRKNNKKSKPTLTAKQERFCLEYIIDLNATAAARRAGYSKKTADVIASQNLGKLSIQARLKELLKEREERTKITADMVIKELALLAFSDPAKLYNEHGHLIPIQELPEEVSRTISEVTSTIRMEGKGDDAIPYEVTKIKQHDKKGSLDSLGKHFGIFEKDNKQGAIVVKKIIREYV